MRAVACGGKVKSESVLRFHSISSSARAFERRDTERREARSEVERSGSRLSSRRGTGRSKGEEADIATKRDCSAEGGRRRGELCGPAEGSKVMPDQPVLFARSLLLKLGLLQKGGSERPA